MLPLDVEDIARLTLNQFGQSGLKPEEIAISVTIPDDPDVCSHYRGDDTFYPASVVKLFFLVAAHQWLQDGRLKETAELQRALNDMIVDSSNDATHYVIDLLTDTTSGPELSEAEMSEWSKKRNRINDYFSKLGFTNVNLNQKPWCEGPYGRDKAFVGTDLSNRNLLTTNATAKVLTDIAQGGAVSPERSSQMMALLKRERAIKSDDPDNQATCFSGRDLSPDVTLFSKAGWTSTTRHDAACIQLPSGKKFIVVTFTKNHAKNYDIIPFVASEVLRQIS